MDSRIRFGAAVAGLAVIAGLSAAASQAQPKKAAAPIAYTADGKLQYPGDYRTWVYLSSGMDMSYTETPGGAEHHMFDNVFVNRESYEAFEKTGAWPDKTIFMLEVRGGQGRGSINKAGQYQGGVMGREAHVKDVSRYKSGWAFFPFGMKEEASTALPQTSGCNTCHEQHGAVDTTFVQFYPTLMPKAQEMKTIAAAYLAEEGAKSGDR